MTHTLTALLLLLGVASAHAQSQKPGLWEHSSTMHARGGEMAQQMAQLLRPSQSEVKKGVFVSR